MIDIGFCPLQLGALNSDNVTRRLKIFFAGAKQRRVGRLQQAQQVLGKAQHSHVQGRKRFSLTFLRLRGLLVLVHPGKLEYFLKTNGWKMYFPIEAVPCLGFMLILRGVFPV